VSGSASRPAGPPSPDASELVPSDLLAAVHDLCARRPVLLALDFDGVLAPIVQRAPDARPLPGVAPLVEELASTDGVTVALVSGRARADLATVSGLGPDAGVLLVGSHGAELDHTGLDDTGPGLSRGPELDDAAVERLQRVVSALTEVAERYPGAGVETKPTAGVLHTRQVARDQVSSATEEALQAVGVIDGAHVTRGKEVVEVAVTEASKGVAVQALRKALGAHGVLYVGDDVTDETVLSSLGPGDVGVKVGEGPTAATYRVASPEAVRELLRALRDLLQAE
jgi:trehalose 6-phosphate phosphatase